MNGEDIVVRLRVVMDLLTIVVMLTNITSPSSSTWYFVLLHQSQIRAAWRSPTFHKLASIPSKEAASLLRQSQDDTVQFSSN